MAKLEKVWGRGQQIDDDMISPVLIFFFINSFVWQTAVLNLSLLRSFFFTLLLEWSHSIQPRNSNPDSSKLEVC